MEITLGADKTASPTVAGQFENHYVEVRCDKLRVRTAVHLMWHDASSKTLIISFGLTSETNFTSSPELGECFEGKSAVCP